MTIYFKTSEILEAAFEDYSSLSTRKKQALSSELKKTIFGENAQKKWQHAYGTEKNPLPKKLLIIEHIQAIKKKYGVEICFFTDYKGVDTAKWVKK